MQIHIVLFHPYIQTAKIREQCKNNVEIFWYIEVGTFIYNGCHFADNIFKRIFLNQNYCITTWIWLKFVPKFPNKQYASSDSDNGLAPNRRQAIVCTNDGLVYWRIYATLGLNELSPLPLTPTNDKVSVLLISWVQTTHRCRQFSHELHPAWWQHTATCRGLGGTHAATRPPSCTWYESHHWSRPQNALCNQPTDKTHNM